MRKESITRIPFPGGSGQIPTGAMEFVDDWPGLFIRGDDALVLLAEIRDLEKKVKNNGYSYFPSLLSRLATIIEQDVLLPTDHNVP
jgi:hypothetical protein